MVAPVEAAASGRATTSAATAMPTRAVSLRRAADGRKDVADSVELPGPSVSEEKLRRWLTCLGQPARLPDPDLLALLDAHGRTPHPVTSVAVGEAARELFTEAIERLRPAKDVPRAQQLPYLVLSTCFVHGLKWTSAADRLGMSPRQLTRERARAIRLLREQLLSVSRLPTLAVAQDRIPAIAQFLPRPAVSRSLLESMSRSRLVHVHGSRGIGKTSLVAELALEHARRVPVMWLRFRPGVNASLVALAFEVGEHLKVSGQSELSDYLHDALAAVDVGIMTRLLLRGLADGPRLLVLDDFHQAATDPAISEFVDEAAERLGSLRVLTVGRHQLDGRGVGAQFAVPPFTTAETHALLAQLDVDAGREIVDAVHQWTEGLPHLVTLAASWLKTASPTDVAAVTTSLGRQDQVQDFLLGAISDLLDAADRAILDAASVFRDRFTDESLAFVSQQTLGAVEDASRRLVRRHLASRSRDGDVAFFHASVREYFYARLSALERAALHERAADWYAERHHVAEARYHRGRAGSG